MGTVQLAVAIASLLVVWPCGGALGQEAKSSVAVTGTDSGRAVNLKTGDTLAVRLASNPSTGYSWEVSEGKADVLLEKNKVFEQGAADSSPGTGGTDVWMFEAVKEGKQKLTFIYRRPWEKTSPAGKTVWYSIVVKRP